MPELINPKGVLFIFLTAGVLLGVCTGSWLEESQQEWKLTHVRLYDPVDSPEPQSDFVAFYARLEQGELQVRIDWLDQELLPAGDLYLAIDNRPGGKKELPGSLIADIAWDTLIQVPFSGEIQALDANFNRQAGFKLRIHRDPVLDTVAIHMDGTLKGLLREEASTGVSVIEAMTPHPVGDLPVEQWADQAGNPRTILWGGIPGVYFTPNVSEDEFDRHVRTVLSVMRSRSRNVLGVADQVPPDCLESRVRRVGAIN